VRYTLPSVPKISHPMDAKIMAQMRASEAPHSFDVVCDFAALPLAFDMVVLMVAAEAYRRNHGYDSFNVIFMADKSDPLPQFHREENPVSIENIETVLFNIGLSAARMFPSAGNLHYFKSRRQFIQEWYSGRFISHWFPRKYDPRHPSYFLEDYKCMAYHPRYAIDLLRGTDDRSQLLSAPKDMIAHVERWLSNTTQAKIIITLTLRETANVVERNSQVKNWQSMVDVFQRQPVHFVVVRDYFSEFGGNAIVGENVTECPQATESIVFRKALYEKANFNLLTNSGSALLCYLDSTVKFAAFNVGLDADSSTVDDMRSQWGLEKGEQLDALNLNGGSRRMLVWERDTLAKLVETIEEVLAEHSVRKKERLE
jgi:hypothetical protein